jgi:hypothetical protein
MRSKLLPTVLAFAVSSVIIAGIALAGTATSTTVTIQVQGRDFSGFVKSPNPDLCANGRKVSLYKQSGSDQSPSTDTKIATDTASRNGDGYQWSTGNTGVSGRFYARARRIPGCKADSSMTVHTQ